MCNQAVFPGAHDKCGIAGFVDPEIHKKFWCKKIARDIRIFHNSSGRNVRKEIPILGQKSSNPTLPFMVVD
ncbi:hypothetical protein [Pelovirga terrestris]|uniref:Uncharacterized protein n=1 Tax=Pelovirga terrestris TaxID=2771352 RepID=A0A8J6QTE8_9BACT|nr:hypothetical protein [Pelovirga terrestris]MBD1399230.1 hypothetical protein [Pelovirga terrestris]